MRPDLFLATIGRGSNGSNALEVTEDRAAVTAESQDNIINRVNNLSQYGPSWHYVPGIGVAGTAYAEVPGSALGDLTFTRASSKTRTNSAGVVETIGNNVPPHDYRNADGTLSTFPRLNLEPQRTNSIRNSSMVGAVAGSPGTTPTNWENASMAGLTRTIVGIGTESGLPYIDLRFVGTATSTVITVWFDITTQIAATTGQTWTNSVYLKLISGTALGYQLTNREQDAGGATLRTGSLNITPTSTLQRFAYTRTNDGTGTAFVRPALWITLTNGATYDFTIRIAAPQMELGAHATTWVPTTTAAVTRLADVAIKTGVSSLIGQAEGTMFIEIDAKNFVSLARIFALSNGNTVNRLILLFPTSTQIRATVTTGATQQFQTNANVTGAGRYKIALAYKNNDFAFYVNGALIGSQTTGTVPACSNIYLGTGESGIGDNILSEGVNQAALFPTRLPNATLAQMTTL